MSSAGVNSRWGVNQTFSPQQHPVQIPDENQELKTRLAAVVQVYKQAMEENEQLKQLIKRGEEISKNESKNFQETLLERDKSIGILKGQVEQLQNGNKNNKDLFDKERSTLKKQLKVQQDVNLDLKKRNDILESALERITKLTITPFCTQYSQEAMEAFRTSSLLHRQYGGPNAEKLISHNQQIVNHVVSLTTCVNETNKKLLKC